MKRRTLLRAAVGAGGAGTLATVAGCLGGEEASPTPGGDDSPTESPSPSPTEADDDGMADGATVTVASVGDLGEILVDDEGRTLYVFTEDPEGESVCYDDCADNWPPLTVEAEPTIGDDVSATIDTVERDDGSMQVAVEGMPLYYFAGDEAPGDANGQGLGDVWYVLAPDGRARRPETETPTESENGGTDDGNGSSDDGDDGGDGNGGGYDRGY